MLPRRLVAFACVVCASPAARGDGFTLEQAVQLALTRNERATISDLNIVVAQAGVDKARAAFLPVLAANGNGTWAPADTGPLGKSPTVTGRGNLTLTMPLIVPTAWPLYDQAKNALVAQHAQTIDDKRQLAFDAAKAYFAVLFADQVVQAAQKKLDTATTNLADTDAQVKAQLVSSNDVTRAQVDLGNSQRELAADRGALDATYVQLELVVNAHVPHGLSVPAGLLEAGERPQPAPDALVALGIKTRPDLAAKRATALAAHDFAREPHMRFFPTLSLQGLATAATNGTPSGHDVDGSVSLTASWSIYDAGVRWADERSRGALAAIADLTTDALVRTVDAQVRTAAAQLAAAQQALGAAKAAMDASRKSADETAILYRQGLAKAIELVDANEQRFLAEVNHAEAEFSLANAYLALLQALGRGPLDAEGI
jgi:outer membrane protein TolC